jgi:leader peptidase (prepilin peptidase)/N-methyltransferase
MKKRPRDSPLLLRLQSDSVAALEGSISIVSLRLFELVLSTAVGLLVGSFLAVLVLRLPKRLPVVIARSACPQCGHELGALELVPVLSWLIQRRRCRACGGRISGFYPFMEIASALVALAAFWEMDWPEAVLACIAGWSALVVGAWAIRKWLFTETNESE